MPVAARKEYVATPRDLVANFHGKQLLYVSWDRHLLFAAPFLLCLPPDVRFGDVIAGPLTQLLQADPDAAALDWDKVEWLKRGAPWKPDFDKTPAENGLTHKEQIRFRTPGLNALIPES